MPKKQTNISYDDDDTVDSVATLGATVETVDTISTLGATVETVDSVATLGGTVETVEMRRSRSEYLSLEEDEEPEEEVRSNTISNIETVIHLVKGNIGN